MVQQLLGVWSMRTVRLVLVLALFFGSGFVLSNRTALVSRLFAQANERREFTAATLTKAYDTQGVERTQEAATFAVRRDGANVTLRKRFISEASGQREINLADIVDVPGRRIVGVDHFTQSTSTSPITDRMLGRYTTRPSASCSDVTHNDGLTTVGIEPQEMLFGQRVFKVTQQRQIAQSGHIARFEKWYAPDLDCFVVRTIATNTAPNGTAARVVMELTSLTLGTPDAQLFVVPDAYPERAPSEIFAESDRLRGRVPACPECRAKANTILDNAYHKRRQER